MEESPLKPELEVCDSVTFPPSRNAIFVFPAMAMTALALEGKIIYTRFPAVNKDTLEKVSCEFFQRDNVF